MRATAERYVSGYQLADITVTGDMGLDEDDESKIEQASGVEKVEYGYLKDVTVSGTHDAIRIWSKPDSISEFEVLDGRLPESDDEIAVSSKLAEEHSIGSTIDFDEKAAMDGSMALSSHSFTVVGVVNSAEIISDTNQGVTQSGTGNLAGYAVVMPDVFDVDYHMVARLTYEDTAGLDPFSQKYLDLVAAHKGELEDLLKDQPEHRLATIQAEYQDSIDEGQKKVDDANRQLNDAKSKLDDAAAQIADAHQQISDSDAELEDAATQLADGRDKLSASWDQLASGKDALDATRSKLAASEPQLQSAAAQLADGRSQLDEKQAEYDAGVKALANAKAQAKQQADTAQGQIDESRQKLEDGKAAYKEKLAALDDQITELNEQLQLLKDQGASEAEIDQLQNSIQLAMTARDALNVAFDTFMNKDADPNTSGDDGGYTVVMAQLDTAQQQLDEQVAAGNTQFAAKQAELDAAAQQLSAARDELAARQAEYDAGKATYDQGVAAYNEGLSTYYAGLDDWQEAATELQEKQGEYEEGAAQLAEAKDELASKEADYESGLAEYEDAKPDTQQKIADGEADLADARATLAKLETPAYNVYNRRETPGAEGYTTYDSISEIVDSLANIFPYFLYLVAVLVVSTTMTRMVDEERIGAGTLKALGYDDRDVLKKFVFYGVTAAVIGTAIGVALGHTLLPYIVYSAYRHGFTLPPIELHFYWDVSLVCLALALITVVLPAYLVARSELAERPAALLLPKAPAAGSKILLERLGFIWRRLPFLRKMTTRNLFRYKKRSLMTIIGVAGAVCLIFTGFAVQHSIGVIADRQFGDIIGYDLIVAENAHVDEDERAAINELLSSDDVESHADVTYESLTKQAGAKNDEQDITLLVPEDADELTKYLDLRDRATGDRLELGDDGAIISERFAELTGTKVGDTLTFRDTDNVERSVTVTGVCEMYMNHFMFMSRPAYEKVFGKEATTNAHVATLKDNNTEATEDMAARFMALSGVKGVVQSTMLINVIHDIVNSLDRIMTILIIVATLLAIVIVYNLVTINVSERIRELSTVKVLGFYDGEVSMYIYRETIILSAIAIPVGWIFGRLLQLYIITAVPPEKVMFSPTTGWLPFAISAGVVAVVVWIQYYIVKHSLRHVDMLEALKSVD
jgi:putative ABC transport system permease protein